MTPPNKIPPEILTNCPNNYPMGLLGALQRVCVGVGSVMPIQLGIQTNQPQPQITPSVSTKDPFSTYAEHETSFIVSVNLDFEFEAP